MKKGWIILIIFSILLTVCLYFYQFNKGLSINSSDWGSFGDYVNGVLSPILTIVNIWVFVRLTQVINSSDKKQKENELLHQKKLVFIQILQNELDKFSSIINVKIIYHPDDKTGYLVYQAKSFLTSFVETKSKLFPIIDSVKFKKVYNDLSIALTKYQETYSPATLAGREEIVSLIQELTENINAINSMLQEFVLSEIQ